jgi:small GTP-binding protein
MIAKKICLIGDFGVGKTSLVRRYVESRFSDTYLSTVGVKIARKTVDLTDLNQNPLALQMMIWDIEGSTKFKAIATSYLQGASGAIIVADVGRMDTITNIATHIQSFMTVNPHSSVIVALNKADLVLDEDLLQILQICAALTQARILGTFPTSAKTGKNVDMIFQALGNAILANS